MKDCKIPLWAKNPLFAIECGHNVCRECIYEVFYSIKEEERDKFVSLECHECKVMNEFNFLILDKNHLLQTDFHRILKAPKEQIQSDPFICEEHEDQQILKHCLLHDEYCCVDCLYDHHDHLKDHVVKVNWTAVKSRIQEAHDLF